MGLLWIPVIIAAIGITIIILFFVVALAFNFLAIMWEILTYMGSLLLRAFKGLNEGSRCCLNAAHSLWHSPRRAAISRWSHSLVSKISLHWF